MVWKRSHHKTGVQCDHHFQGWGLVLCQGEGLGRWWLTSAQRLRIIPVWVTHIDTLNDGWALLQRVAGIAGEFHNGPNVVGGVRCGEIPVLDVGFIAVTFLKG